MNLTKKLIFVRRLVAVCVPKSFRGRVPKKISKHLYFYGWISVSNNGKHLFNLWNHSELENSIYWSGGEISKCTEGLTLNLFTQIIERFELKSFLDGGANSGTYGLVCLGSNTSIKTVTFVEPLPAAVEILQKNLSSNKNLLQKNTSIRVIESALTDFDGISNLFLDPEKKIQFSATLQKTFSNKNTDSIEVRCSKVSTLIDEGNLVPPDIVKLDIEGAEFESLIGFGKYFSNIEFLFIEILNSSYAIRLASLFGKSHFTFIDIDDRNNKLNFIDSLTGSSHRNILVFKTEYRKQVESIVHELAKSY